MRSPTIPLLFCFFFLVAPLSSQTIEWQQNYGGSELDKAFDVEACPGNGYIAVGFSRSSDQDLNGNNGGEDLWVTRVDSSGNLEWQKNLGGSDDDKGRAVTVTSDSGYVIAASSWSSDGDVSSNQGKDDFWILKLDSSGSLLWKKSFGGSGRDIPYSIKKGVNGGFIVFGSSSSSDGDFSNNYGKSDYWVLKLDANGSIEWKEHYGGPGRETAGEVMRPSNGGYLLAGHSGSDSIDVSGNFGQRDFWAVKIDTNGSIEWKGHYGGNWDEKAYAVVENAKGHYFLAGYSDSDELMEDPRIGVQDVWVIELDTSGNLLMEERYGGEWTDKVNGMVAHPSGGFIAAGIAEYQGHDVSNAFNGYDYDHWVIRCDNTGKLISEHSFGGTDDEEAEDLIRLSNGNLVVAGESGSNDSDLTANYGSRDQWLYEIDGGCSAASVDHSPSDRAVCEGDTVKLRVQRGFFSCVDTFQWQENDGSGWTDLNSSNTDTLVLNKVQASQQGNQYRCILSDSSGVKDTSQAAELLISTGLTFTSRDDSTLCYGGSSGSLTVSATGGIGPYKASIDSGYDQSSFFDDSLSYSNLDTGIYYIRIEDSIGCKTSFGTDTVHDPPELIAQAGADDSLCIDDSVKIGQSPVATGGVGGYSHTWSPSTGLGSQADTPKVSPSSTTTYNLEVSDSNGCQDTGQVMVRVFDPKPDIGQDTGICRPDSSTTLQADPEFTSYTWSTGGTSSSTQADTTGFYWVKVEDSNACQESDTVQVLIDSTTSAKLVAKDTGFHCNTQPSQYFLAEQVDVQMGPPIFDWWTSDGNIVSNSSLDSIQITEGGTYHLRMKDSVTGCRYEDSLTFHGDTLDPYAIILGDSLLNSSSDTAVLDGSSSSGALGTISYDWWSPSGGQIVSNDTLPQLKVTEEAYYVLEVEDQVTGCTTIDSIYVDGPSALQKHPKDLKVKAYPDPTGGRFQISFDRKLKWVEWTLRDLKGRVLQRNTEKDRRKIQLHIRGQSGLYFLHLKTESGVRTLRIIKE